MAPSDGFQVSAEALKKFSSDIGTLVTSLQNDWLLGKGQIVSTLGPSGLSRLYVGQESDFSSAFHLGNDYSTAYTGFEDNFNSLITALTALQDVATELQKNYENSQEQDKSSVEALFNSLSTGSSGG
jgi:hypothetical protein